MEVRFRTSKGKFRHEVQKAWRKGMAGPTINKAAYNRLLQVLQEQVHFLPARGPALEAPGVQRERGGPEFKGAAKEKRLFFKKAGKRKAALTEKRRKVLKLLLLGRYTSRSIVKTVGVTWSQVKYVQRLAKTTTAGPAGKPWRV